MGVHESHCCIEHGCKYSDGDCPVATGKTKQEGPCEWCGLESSDYFDSPDGEEHQLVPNNADEFKSLNADEFKSLMAQAEIHVGNAYLFLIKRAKNSEGFDRERAIQGIGKFDLILSALSKIKRDGF